MIACNKKQSSLLSLSDPAASVPSSDKIYRYYGDFRVEADSQLSTKASTGFEAYHTLPWPNGDVPVRFHWSINKTRQAQFWSACKEWSDVAKVRCRAKKSSDKNYLLVIDQRDDACWTDVGAGKDGGERVFNFSANWCWSRLALVHDIGHVFGLMHEHQRPDRDQYIDVHMENAAEDEYSYTKLSVGELDNKGPYDFMSIMHYWNAAYSINGKPIMVPKPGYEAYANTMGTATQLSRGDRLLIKKIYGN